MKVDIDAAGVRQQLYLMFHDIDEAGAEVATEWAEFVQTRAESDVAVDTGFLQSHISKRVSKTKMSAQVGVFDPKGYYGDFIERGTQSIDADPFLGPAADDANALLEEFTRRAIDRHLPG